MQQGFRKGRERNQHSRPRMATTEDSDMELKEALSVVLINIRNAQSLAEDDQVYAQLDDILYAVQDLLDNQ